MLIIPEYNKPYIIENISSPVIPKYYWSFAGQMLDYVLSPLVYLEETTGPSVTIEINEFSFDVPAHWNILIVDPTTYQIDTVPIASCSTSHTFAVLMAPDDYRVRKAPIKVTGYKDDDVLVHPLIQKGMGLCHPAGIDRSMAKPTEVAVILTPHDLYKFIADKSIGDLLP